MVIPVCNIMFFCRIKELDSMASQLLSSWGCVGMDCWETTWTNGKKTLQWLCHLKVWSLNLGSAITSCVTLDKSLNTPELHLLYVQTEDNIHSSRVFWGSESYVKFLAQRWAYSGYSSKWQLSPSAGYHVSALYGKPGFCSSFTQGQELRPLFLSSKYGH